MNDLNSAFKNSYELSIVAGHDGTLFAYKSNEEISERIFDMYVAKFFNSGYNEYEAVMETLKRLKRNYDFDFWEVKSDEK